MRRVWNPARGGSGNPTQLFKNNQQHRHEIILAFFFPNPNVSPAFVIKIWTEISWKIVDDCYKIR
jgi:hypothetical protein